MCLCKPSTIKHSIRTMRFYNKTKVKYGFHILKVNITTTQKKIRH